ncbi:hypothetical protein N866_06870 [Actinotalea ferrariae CF5-4]|uniref:Uncharacterized protein n=1 Tax=Actinotalea ferrariae CF5-4 TaxID=948458 RepID=A0A021VN91_9CELL|nr:hypothetical protein [Actinotalea ferrariae]EYR62621.1 hypothetical protein N866_06870 [Actinotalea ferrariae CF5-4]
MPTTRADAAEKVLDTRTALLLGQALFAFIARAGEEAESDDFSLEDAGIDIRSGFIELPSSVTWELGDLLEKVDAAASS